MMLRHCGKLTVNKRNRLTVVTDSAICLYAFEMGTLLYMERFNGDTQWGKLIYILIQ